LQENSRSLPSLSSIERSMSDDPAGPVITVEPGIISARRGRSKRRLIVVFRWLHIYLSMISFAAMFFFAATGLMLNHVRWFQNQQTTTRYRGRLHKSWVGASGGQDVAKLEIVEYLRQTHGIGGAVHDFNVDPSQCVVSFKGPGYAADVFIDRETGQYEILENRMGTAAILNDLHKGRDTGKAWSWFIDICAVMMSVVSLTGLILIFVLQRNRISGLIALCSAAIISYVIYRACVPQ
jgi:hypothetical protein